MIQGAWDIMKAYIIDHVHAEFSHGLCLECFHKQVDELEKKKTDLTVLM